MNKEEFIVQAQSILEKYPVYYDINEWDENRDPRECESNKEVLIAIKSDLNDALSKHQYLSDSDFPIEFEDSIGKWELYEDGTTYFQLKTERGFWGVTI